MDRGSGSRSCPVWGGGYAARGGGVNRAATSAAIMHPAMGTGAADALRTILPLAGWGDPILPTPFRIGETSAAALAAVGLAASELWEVRTGRRQHVAVDSRQATASLRSAH